MNAGGYRVSPLVEAVLNAPTVTLSAGPGGGEGRYKDHRRLLHRALPVDEADLKTYVHAYYKTPRAIFTCPPCPPVPMANCCAGRRKPFRGQDP